jgi:hypothetical protein
VATTELATQDKHIYMEVKHSTSCYLVNVIVSDEEFKRYPVDIISSTASFVKLGGEVETI